MHSGMKIAVAHSANAAAIKSSDGFVQQRDPVHSSFWAQNFNVKFI
jgi:hypothetical protein